MPKLLYLPLEPYKERYTEFLKSWTEAAFTRLGWDVLTIAPDPWVGKIETGAVLDAHGRCRWAALQTAKLAEILRNLSTGLSPSDWVYFDDMFHPGYAAVPYILAQTPKGRRPRVAVRNYAQSVDPDDFTHPWRDWMRPYEEMVYRTADAVFCASTCHKELMAVANLPVERVYVTGLPFDVTHVRNTARSVRRDPRKVVYASRWDSEKQPGFFLDIVKARHQSMRFVVCTGAQDLRGEVDPVQRALGYETRQWLTIRRNCTKAEYYEELASATVQLNTARQDFVSFTALEASALGTVTLAPAFRSFPETLGNRDAQLYAPWVLDDALRKLDALVSGQNNVPDVGRVADYHAETFARCSAIMGRAYD